MINWLKKSAALGFVCIACNSWGYEAGGEPLKEQAPSTEPWEIKVKSFFTGEASFDDAALSDETLVIGGVEGVVYAPLYKEENFAWVVRGGYKHFQIDWSNNPLFERKHYEMLRLGCSLDVEVDERWKIEWEVDAFFDVSFWDVARNSLYTSALHGRYAYNDDIGLHIGFWGITGIQRSNMLPVLGFDWKIDDRWMLICVMPQMFQLRYHVNDASTALLEVKPILYRHRLDHDEVLSDGIFHYQGSSANLAFEWKPLKWLSGKAFFGFVPASKIKTYDTNGDWQATYDQKSTYIGGLEIDCAF